MFDKEGQWVDDESIDTPLSYGEDIFANRVTDYLYWCKEEHTRTKTVYEAKSRIEKLVDAYPHHKKVLFWKIVNNVKVLLK